MTPGSDVKEGLEDVVIGTSNLGHVDGENGELYYCGYNIDDLATDGSYEETVYLLFNNTLPTEHQLNGFTERLTEHRFLPADVENVVDWIADRTTPMDVLRTVTSLLAAYADDADNPGNVDDLLLRLVAVFPTVIAYTYRLRNDKDIIKPDEDLGHAANFLYMLHGEKPGEKEEAAMDAALTLYAEHGMNASTFSGVVTASTLANPYSSITSAVGALQGPLHGGATETVDSMLQEIGAENKAEPFLREKLEHHEKVPGFGHRVYEVTDPRCKHFKRYAENIGDEEAGTRLAVIDTLRDVMEEELGEEGIWPNADLYSGTLYNALRIPSAFYTTMFAMARVAGWSAHVLEQRAHNRIIRPLVEYDGGLGKEYIPVEDR